MKLFMLHTDLFVPFRYFVPGDDGVKDSGVSAVIRQAACLINEVQYTLHRVGLFAF